MLRTRGSNGKRYEEVDIERVIDVFKRKEKNTRSIQKRGTMYISCLQNRGLQVRGTVVVENNLG